MCSIIMLYVNQFIRHEKIHHSVSPLKIIRLLMCDLTVVIIFCLKCDCFRLETKTAKIFFISDTSGYFELFSRIYKLRILKPIFKSAISLQGIRYKHF